MAERKFWLITLAIALAYVVLFLTTREPVCLIGSASRVSIKCATSPPKRPKREERPAHGIRTAIIAGGIDAHAETPPGKRGPYKKQAALT